MIHELRIWPIYFEAVVLRDKRCEIRKDDRGYRAGDYLRLREWNPTKAQYTGAEITAMVTHITPLADVGIDAGYVALSIDVVPASYRVPALRLIDAG
jgi:hypothetical protein